jgi:signal transduction histidine kinase
MGAFFGKETGVPALRRVAQVASAVVIGIAVALVLTLVLVGMASARATQRVSDAATDAALADVLEARFRSQERLGGLYRLSGNEAYALQRSEELAKLQVGLRNERVHSDNDYERKLVAGAEATLERHLATQAKLEGSGASPATIVQATHPSFSTVLAHLAKLRSVHRGRIEEARRNAEMLRTATIGAGLVGLVMLTVTIAGCMLTLRRWVFRPLTEVARALDRMGRGERRAKISQPMPLEMGELAGSVNDLSEALEGKHDNQVRYLGMLAHDLRNPLTALRLTVDRLRNCALPAAERERACELVSRQIDRFDRMVQELLDAARVESGKLDVRLQRADLRALASDVVELHRAACPNELRLVTPPSPVEASVDPMRIEQVLGNLVLNAIHHSPKGGSIDVVVKPSSDEVCMSVTDSGPGIPPELVEKIFTPFFQRSTKNGPRGTGLGLSIVRQIVEAHGGRVEVDTKVGRGSTFRVRLPRDRTPGARFDASSSDAHASA